MVKIMKLSRQANLILLVICSIILALGVVISFITHNTDSYKSIGPLLSELYTCSRENGKPLEKDHFSVSDEVSLCLTLETDDGNESILKINIYKDRFNLNSCYYCATFSHLTNRSYVIPINTVFEPGYYVYNILNGKNIIGSGYFSIDG